MENTIEIAPNQLPLFDMLTVEQEQELARIKANTTRDVNKRIKEVEDKIALLIKAGFTNRHYGYNLECNKIIREVNVANWRDTPKMVETELDSSSGNCHLIYSRYDKSKNEIITAKAGFDIRNGKIECSNLTNNWRQYKPESILAKIEESYEITQNQYDMANKMKSVVEYTVNKYKKLYPEAEVTADKGYTSGRNYSEYDKVTIKFKSGSYVSFQLGGEKDREYTVDKYDAVFKKLTINEVMDHFNTQEAR
jgi:hypothetical protein